MKKFLEENWYVIVVPILVFIALNEGMNLYASYVTSKNISSGLSTLWEVYEDKEGGVTCYIYKDDSISCLPTKDLTK